MRRIAAAVAALMVSACGAEKATAPAPTWAQYERIQPGMSYSTVTALLGQQGDQRASNKVDGQTIRTYAFGGSDGRFYVHFNGNVVANKSNGTLQAPPL
jgi:hypothetical protein